MNLYYWNAAGQRLELPEQELVPPDARLYYPPRRAGDDEDDERED